MSNRAKNVNTELMNLLWVEKYRPKNLDEMALSDNMRDKFQSFIDDKEIPHILLYGKQGTGKTTISKILIDNIDCDVKEVDGSSENGVDDVRDGIKPFLSRISEKKWIIIVIDEADYLSTNAQKALLKVIEETSEFARFIVKCNDINKLIDPFKSRFQKFNLQDEGNKASLVSRVDDILEAEGVKYNREDLVTIFENCYPDIRDIIGQINQFTVNGELKLDESALNGLSSSFVGSLTDVLSKYKVGNKGQKPYVKNDLRRIKQSIVNNKITDFKVLFNFLYEVIDDNQYVSDEDVETYLDLFVTLGEHNINHLRCVNKELDVLSLMSKVLDKLNKSNNK